LSAAASIRKRGFRPTPVAELISDVAEQYGIPHAHLRDHLATNGRFTDLDHRVGSTSFTSERGRAGSWAQRAPEARWEALWSVYRLRHPELGDDWNQSDEGHFWVMAQDIHDPPAVVEVRAALNDLRSVRKPQTAADLFADFESDGREGEFVAIFKLMSEWRPHAGSHVDIIGIEEVPIRADRSLARFMSGQAPAVFAAQVDDGLWGQPGDGDPRAGLWFPFSELWRRLPPSHRGELSDIARQL